MHIPAILLAGIFYFGMKFIINCHLLLNIYKDEIDSSGEITHNTCLKVIGLLIFYQLCIIIKMIAQKQYVPAGIIFIMAIFTFIVYVLYRKDRILRTSLFIEQDYDIDSCYVSSWRNLYRHPVRDYYDAQGIPGNKVGFNNQDFRLKKKVEYLADDLNRLRDTIDKVT